MKKEVDFTYIVDGIFIKFFPQSRDGENAWREMVKENDGHSAFWAHHKNSILKQMRRAGYVVLKTKPSSKKLTKADFELLDQLQK